MPSGTDTRDELNRQPPEEIHRIVLAGIGVVVFWIAGIISTLPILHSLNMGVAILGASIAIATLWTFLLFYRAADIRTAVFAAFMVLYLGFLVASTVPGAASTLEKPGSFAHTIWDNLSALIIAIIGFYFGGKTIEGASANVAKKSKRISDAPSPTDLQAIHTD